jgi:hypothetical protein
LRESSRSGLKILVRCVTVLLLALNLVLVTRAVALGNRQLEPFTAGIEAVGRGHRIFVCQLDRRPPPLVDPLLHAADYYCLGSDNVNVDNYEATTPHFPIKFRSGQTRGRNNWTLYPGRDAIDVLLCWRLSPPAGAGGPAGWDMIFSQGRLRIYRRPRLP